MLWKDFVTLCPYCKFIDEGFALAEITSLKGIDGCEINKTHCLFFVTNGSMTIKIESLDYVLTKNTFADIVGKSSVSFISCSDNVHAWGLFFTETFLANLLKNNPPFPVSYVMERQTRPLSQIQAKDMKLVCNRINIIEKEFDDAEHIFHSRMIALSFLLLLMDIANVFIHTEQNEIDKTQENEANHSKQLFLKFMRLVPLYIKKEHSVAFFAQEMCITPQYLARIVKQNSGATVYGFIEKHLIGETLRELRETDKSIAQIAEEYNFADPATFTKFFKRHMKTTPSAYRNISTNQKL